MKNLLKNKIFWFGICVLISVISGFLYNSLGIASLGIISIAALIYPAVLVFLMLIFAWIINPIKLFIAYIKKRKNNVVD
jgi:hypothetical protein